MYHFVLEIIEICVACTFLVLAYKSASRRLLNTVIGIFFLFLFIKDVNHTFKVVDHLYFLEGKAIQKIQIKPFKRTNTITLDSIITVQENDKIQDILAQIGLASTTKLSQPNSTRTILLNLVDVKQKHYEYFIEYTTNNGILVSVKIDDSFYGGFRNDSIFSSLYKITNSDFFR